MQQGAERTELIMDMIYDFIDNFGYAPTIREIQSALEIPSSSSVSYHLGLLRLSGRIDYVPGQSRSIRLPNQRHSDLKMLVYRPGIDTRQRIVDYIGWYCESYGRSPSFQDIADNVKVGKSVVSYHLKLLRKKGVIDYEDTKFRSVRPVEHAEKNP